jgi:hypothetical protein
VNLISPLLTTQNKPTATALCVAKVPASTPALTSYIFRRTARTATVQSLLTAPTPTPLSVCLLVGDQLALMGLTRGQTETAHLLCVRGSDGKSLFRVRCPAHITSLSQPALLRLVCSCAHLNQVVVIDAVQAQHVRSAEALNEGGCVREECEWRSLFRLAHRMSEAGNDHHGDDDDTDPDPASSKPCV